MHAGSVAVVLRARPLRGGQPYVLLLQHGGVHSHSAAVQARVQMGVLCRLCQHRPDVAGGYAASLTHACHPCLSTWLHLQPIQSDWVLMTL